jgi:hypothetical protein
MCSGLIILLFMCDTDNKVNSPSWNTSNLNDSHIWHICSLSRCSLKSFLCPLPIPLPSNLCLYVLKWILHHGPSSLLNQSCIIWNRWKIAHYDVCWHYLWSLIWYLFVW